MVNALDSIRRTGLICIIAFLSCIPAMGQNSQDRLLEEIVASEKRQGPPLWKVSNGSNSIWLFGILSPHPMKSSWDSQSVRLIMSESDVYITPHAIRIIERNPFKIPGLVRRLSRFKRIPDDGNLEDVLPAELYSRFLAAKETYAPRDSKMLKLRPLFAAEKLYQAALISNGMVMNEHMANNLSRIAKRNGIEINPIELRTTGEEFREFMENTDPPPNIACIEATLDSIETDLEGVVNRAEAWENGDVSAFRLLDYPDVDGACVYSHLAQDQDLRNEWERTQSQWFEKVEEALSENRQSFGSLPIRELVHPDGLLARLLAENYTVRIL